MFDLEPDPLRRVDFIAHLAYERVFDDGIRYFLYLVQEAHFADVVVVKIVSLDLVRLLNNVDHDVEESDVAGDFLVRGVALLLGGTLDFVKVPLGPSQELVHVRQEVLQLIALLRDHLRGARFDLVDLLQYDREGRVQALEGVCLQRIDLLDLERVVVRVRFGQQDRAFFQKLHVILDFVVKTFVVVLTLE